MPRWIGQQTMHGTLALSALAVMVSAPTAAEAAAVPQPLPPLWLQSLPEGTETATTGPSKLMWRVTLRS